MSSEDFARYENKKKVLAERLVMLEEKRARLEASKKYSGEEKTSRLAKVDAKIKNSKSKIARCDEKISRPSAPAANA